MTHSHEPDHSHDREVIVEDRGSSLGAIIGILVIIALLVAVWWFAFGPGVGTFGQEGAEQPTINIDVDAPAPGGEDPGGGGEGEQPGDGS
jgi:hypothetical protein